MTDHAELVAEVEAAYRNYLATFNGRDPESVAGIYDRPHAYLTAEHGLRVVQTDADQQGWFDFVMRFLDDQGWGYNELDRIWVWPLSATLAQVVAEFTRHKTDGSVLNHARCHYVFRRRDDGWKVSLSLPVLEDGFVPPGMLD